ncbi:MAG TPA: hypothetical protein VIF33_00100 [Casimicrobiaceae bacterium]
MEDIATDEAEFTFQVERRQDATPEHAAREIRRRLVDGVDHQVRDFVAMIVPGVARQHVADARVRVLAEKARDVHAGRRQRRVQRRRDQHFDDRRARPAKQLRVEIRALHVRERRCDDNAAAVVRLR